MTVRVDPDLNGPRPAADNALDERGAVDGLAAVTAGHHRVKQGQQVSLAFAIDLGAVTKLHRRTAVVAHISGGGTGLMMDAFAAAR